VTRSRDVLAPSGDPWDADFAWFKVSIHQIMNSGAVYGIMKMFGVEIMRLALHLFEGRCVSKQEETQPESELITEIQRDCAYSSRIITTLQRRFMQTHRLWHLIGIDGRCEK
jgi:hypothetical protein